MMKKTIVLLGLVCACFAQALEHTACNPQAKNAEQRKIKWSSAKWFSNGNYVSTSKPLPTKPGPGDNASVIWGGYTLELDQDVNVANLGVGADSDLFAKKRNIKVKRNLSIAMSHNSKRGTNVKFDGCNIELGRGISFSFYDRAQSAGYTNVEFKDTNLDAKGDFVCLVPANDRFKNKEPMGITMRIDGKNMLDFGGGVVMDEIFKLHPREWFFKWRFEENNGQIGTVRFSKLAKLDSSILEVKLSDKLKPGKYTLMEFNDKKSFFKPSKVLLNGKPYNMGETVSVGGKSVVLRMGASPLGRDTRTENDLILEVLK